MYLAQFFDSQFGDLTSVQPAESFDDAVSAVLAEVGRVEGASVTASWVKGIGSLKVEKDDIVLASVADTPVAAPTPAAEVVEACNALQAGDTAAIVALFQFQPADLVRAGYQFSRPDFIKETL